MSTEIINSYTGIIKNKKLQSYTKQIMSQGVNIKKAAARIAVILCKIDESKCYETDGFQTVHDYAEHVLGWKKSNSYAMLKVGYELLDHKTYESLLPHDSGCDFSTSQLQAILPLKSLDTATHLVESGEILPTMSVKDIKEVVKGYTSDSKSAEGESSDSESVEDANAEDDVIEAEAYGVLHEIKLAEDKEGNRFILCDDVVVTRESLLLMIERF